MSKAVILLNLGTPAAPTATGLRAYYRRFFADPFVFDFNPIARWVLRNAIILPFRAPRVAKDYAAIWMEEGSPLKVYADRMQRAVQASFDAKGEEVLVRNAMAYSSPLVSETMAELEAEGVTEILLLPMFPQYSSATTASIFQSVKNSARHWQQQPTLRFVNDLFQEDAFIKAWVGVIERQLDTESVDHVIFSYHGVPEKTILKASEPGVCQLGNCCEQVNSKNRSCYRMQCVQSTHSIAARLGWDSSFFSMAFQSRFGPLPWTQPYLDEHIQQLRDRGVERLAVVTPSFVSDCLETLFEIGREYRHEFEEAGGKEFTLVPNLNDDPQWFQAVYQIADRHMADTSLQALE